MKNTVINVKKQSLAALIGLLILINLISIGLMSKSLWFNDKQHHQQQFISVERWIEYTAFKNRLAQSLEYYKGLAQLSNLENKLVLKEQFPDLVVQGGFVFDDIQLIGLKKIVPMVPSDKKDYTKHLLELLHRYQQNVLALKPASKASIANYELCVSQLTDYVDSLMVKTELRIVESDNDI